LVSRKVFTYKELIESRLLYKLLEWNHLRLAGVPWKEWWTMYFDPIEKSITVEYE
jgi:hypothetical protein